MSELKTIYGEVIFALEGAKTIFQLVRRHVTLKRPCARPTYVEPTCARPTCAGPTWVEPTLSGPTLHGSRLWCGADLSAPTQWGRPPGSHPMPGPNLRGKKIEEIKVFTGLAEYQAWSQMFQNGERWIRMG